VVLVLIVLLVLQLMRRGGDPIWPCGGYAYELIGGLLIVLSSLVGEEMARKWKVRFLCATCRNRNRLFWNRNPSDAPGFGS